MNKGYVKLYRKFRTWEWYDDVNCKVLFLELLLTVNFEDKKWQGNEVKAGEIITSYDKMAIKTNLSIQQVRTSLKKLKDSDVIKIETTTKFTKISIVNFDTYQGNGKEKEPIKEPVKKEVAIKEPKEVKNKYGEYKHVKLTNKQYQSCLEFFIEEKYLNQAIKILDDYCESKGNAYKNYSIPLKGWVAERLKKEHGNETGIKNLNITKNIMEDFING